MDIVRINPAGIIDLSELISQAAVIPDLGLVYLSGQVAWDMTGTLVGEGSHAEQAEQIVKNIDVALSAAGTSRAHLVKETVYVVELTPDLIAPIIGALRAGDVPPPASSMVGVASLAGPACLVEIEVVARIPR